MPRKARGSEIDRSVLMLILKQRKLTITKLAEETGYNRRALNYAISRQYMDNQTLMDISKYLDVSPSVITGKYPLRTAAEWEQAMNRVMDAQAVNQNRLMKLKTEYLSFSDIGEYKVPSYDFWEFSQNLDSTYPRPIGKYRSLYYDFLLALGEEGIDDPKNPENVIHFDNELLYGNMSYLIPPIKDAAEKTVLSVINNDHQYQQWKDSQADQTESSDHFDMIEEGEASDE